MRLFCWLVALLLPARAADLLPLRDVKAGQKGIGRTVFAGSRVEEFGVEIVGVLENIGPRQSLILAKLSGGPLAETGVMQGMSGSPVYIDGKLAGAVSSAFPYAKAPIAGIRPIEEMIGAAEEAGTVRLRAWVVPPRLELIRDGDATGRAAEVRTPIALAGFTPAAIDHFAGQWRALGLEPRQGAGGGGAPGTRLGDPSRIEPGSMISVQLISGDISAGADGTVTHIDGRRVYAFGHRFLSVGATELPFARAEVLALLPNLATSFKIATAREWMGVITQDRSSAIAGELGRAASMVPVRFTVRRAGRVAPVRQYSLQVVNDRFLAPFLLQVALFSAIDATERTMGASSVTLRGEARLEGAAPIRLDNVYSGDFNVPAVAALGVSAPLGYLLQQGFGGVRLKGIDLTIEAADAKRQAQIDQLWVSRATVRPGEDVLISLTLSAGDDPPLQREVRYTVPVGAAAGALYFTVADAATTNLLEYQHLMNVPPRSPAQVVGFLNSLRTNDAAYLRVWRNEPSYGVQGMDLPAPPASVSLVLARGQSALGPGIASRNARLREFRIGADGMAVSGLRTVQVEVKE